MNTGSSSENIQLFAQSWSVDRVTTIPLKVWQGAQAQQRWKAPRWKGKAGVHGWAGGQWLPPLLLHWDHGE